MTQPDDLTALMRGLQYAKDAVRTLLDSPNSTVDMHGLTYWAGVVEKTRESIKEKL